MVSGPVDWGNV